MMSYKKMSLLPEKRNMWAQAEQIEPAEVTDRFFRHDDKFVRLILNYLRFRKKLEIYQHAI